MSNTTASYVLSTMKDPVVRAGYAFSAAMGALVYVIMNSMSVGVVRKTIAEELNSELLPLGFKVTCVEENNGN